MYIYLDTETTGTGPDDRLCQIAFKADDGPAICDLFNPGKPISIDAMAIHHITEKMVADKPTFKESDTYAKLQELISDINNVIVAHNAQFDMKMLNMEGIFTQRVICTIKLARYLDPSVVIPICILERFFRSLKSKRLLGYVFTSRKSAQMLVVDYIGE